MKLARTGRDAECIKTTRSMSIYTTLTQTESACQGYFQKKSKLSRIPKFYLAFLGLILHNFRKRFYEEAIRL